MASQDVSIADEDSGKFLTIKDKDVEPVAGENVALVRDVSLPFVKDNIKSQKITVSGTAIKLPTVPLLDRKSVSIQNEGGDKLFIGDSTVTVNTGWKIKKNKSISMDLSDNVDVWGISNGTCNVRILELG